MRSRAAFVPALLTLGCLLYPARLTEAAINAYGLGASYDSTQSNVIFRVYSSRATQIEVDLYASPMGSPEVLRSSAQRRQQYPYLLRFDTGRDASGSRHHRAGVLRLSRLGAELAFFEQLDQGFRRRLYLGRGRPRQPLQPQ